MVKVKHPSTSPSTEHTCCGTIQDVREKSHSRRSKPQPWIVLKFMVPFSLGIIGYSTYVYVVRFCVRMIKRESGALAGRTVGSKCIPRLAVLQVELSCCAIVVFLVVFAILVLWVLWAYVKVRIK